MFRRGRRISVGRRRTVYPDTDTRGDRQRTAIGRPDRRRGYAAGDPGQLDGIAPGPCSYPHLPAIPCIGHECEKRAIWRPPGVQGIRSCTSNDPDGQPIGINKVDARPDNVLANVKGCGDVSNPGAIGRRLCIGCAYEPNGVNRSKVMGTRCRSRSIGRELAVHCRCVPFPSTSTSRSIGRARRS